MTPQWHRMTGLKPQEHRCICSRISTNRCNQKTRFPVCVTLSWAKKIRPNGKDSRKEYKKKQRKHLSKQEKINFENNMSDLIWFLSFSISTLSASRNWLRWREHTHHQNVDFFLLKSAMTIWVSIPKMLEPHLASAAFKIRRHPYSSRIGSNPNITSLTSVDSYWL